MTLENETVEPGVELALEPRGDAEVKLTSPDERAYTPAPAGPIRLPTRHNPRLAALLERVNADEELAGLWRCANVIAVDRLGMSDHGPVHVRIVANIALRLLRLLRRHGVEASIVRDHHLVEHDAEVVVVAAALLHDIGMAIHRDDHEAYSLFLALPRLQSMLDGVYPDVTTRTIITAEVLHAIISHRSGGHPITVEAGIVKIADALDITKGRSRIPFEAGQVNIHSLSATAIEKVSIGSGVDRPVLIEVAMANSAGIFQLDRLREKLKTSGLGDYFEVVASIQGETEKRLVQDYRI